MTDVAKAHLKKRHAAEGRFKLYGQIAIIIAIGFLALLIGRIVSQGYTTFTTNTVTLPVYLDPARIDTTNLAGSNFDYVVALSLLKKMGETEDEFGANSADAMDLVSRDLGFQILDRLRADRSLIGKTITISGPMKADADLYYKGAIKRTTVQGDRKLNDRQLDWLDRLKESGAVTSSFNTAFFTNSDSTEPEQAGVLGAVVGSMMALLVAALVSVPLGVMAAVYLEEFASRNRLTDLIEVNINNLAAVPSIVYGLLGLSVFIGWAGMPRSSALVAGLVLALMALPTIVITTRSAIKAVPPSIREAALGVGASRTQMVFHHVLPLALPGVMTGTIISMAHALGETAPLLMIGGFSFVPGVAESFTAATATLPVQVFIWETASERAFHERTAAAIIVLLVFMIVMNAAAVILRRRFERRW